MDWQALSSHSDTGNSAILSYQLTWDEATSAYIDLIATESLELSHLLVGLESHLDFQF